MLETLVGVIAAHHHPCDSGEQVGEQPCSPGHPLHPPTPAPATLEHPQRGTDPPVLAELPRPFQREDEPSHALGSSGEGQASQRAATRAGAYRILTSHHHPSPATGSPELPAPHQAGWHTAPLRSPPATDINKLPQIVILFQASPHNLNDLILQTITFNYLQVSMKSGSIQGKRERKLNIPKEPECVQPYLLLGQETNEMRGSEHFFLPPANAWQQGWVPHQVSLCCTEGSSGCLGAAACLGYALCLIFPYIFIKHFSLTRFLPINLYGC